ncbi:MAG: hypothetical protein AAF493_01635 [Pseudomonadota bacterium]
MDTIQVEVYDTSSPNPNDSEFALRLEVNSTRVRVRDLIRFRVEQELEQRTTRNRALIDVSDEERELNGEHERGEVKLEAKLARHVEVALAGFEENAYFVLDGNGQFENLDDEVDLTQSNQITFYRLLPLVGG